MTCISGNLTHHTPCLKYLVCLWFMKCIVIGLTMCLNILVSTSWWNLFESCIILIIVIFLQYSKIWQWKLRDQYWCKSCCHFSVFTCTRKCVLFSVQIFWDICILRYLYLIKTLLAVFYRPLHSILHF